MSAEGRLNVPTPRPGLAPEPVGGGGGSGGGNPGPNPIAGAPACTVRYPSVSQPAGSGPYTQTVDMVNNGNAPLQFDRVELHQDTAGGWTIDASAVVGTLAPGQSKPLKVTFTPPAK